MDQNKWYKPDLALFRLFFKNAVFRSLDGFDRTIFKGVNKKLT